MSTTNEDEMMHQFNNNVGDGAADLAAGGEEAAAPYSSPMNAILSVLRRKLSTVNIHDNSATEQDGNDKDGEQGGQSWAPPSSSPTLRPTTPAPTSAPTGHPTMHGKNFILRGIMWYDRNANGVRDSNVNVNGMGSDVEYSHGVGGMQVQLVECDGDTGR